MFFEEKYEILKNKFSGKELIKIKAIPLLNLLLLHSEAANHINPKKKRKKKEDQQ